MKGTERRQVEEGEAMARAINWRRYDALKAQGRSEREIADALGIPRTTLRRAIEKRETQPTQTHQGTPAADQVQDTRAHPSTPWYTTAARSPPHPGTPEPTG